MPPSRMASWWEKRSCLKKCLLVSALLLILGLTLALVFVTTLPCSSNRGTINCTRVIVNYTGPDSKANYTPASVDRGPTTNCTGVIVNHTGPDSKANYTPASVDRVSKDKPSVCLTPGCISIAAEYLKKANLGGDPCKNFYDFACGQYEADSGISEYESPVVDAKINIQYRLKEILDSPPGGKENNAFKKVRTFYNACKNMTEINLLEEKPLQALLKQLGGWPVVEGIIWSLAGGRNFDWTETIYAMRKIGVPHSLLVSLSVVIDDKNSSRYALQVDKSSLGFEEAATTFDEFNVAFVQEYLKLMINTAVLLGANSDTAVSELRRSLLFELELAKLTILEENRTDIKTFADLQRIAPMVNWVEFANKLLMDKVNKYEIINVASPNYLEQLTVLLMTTPKRTIANYLMWRVVLSVKDKLGNRMRNNWLEFEMAVRGQTGDQPRWLTCLQTTKFFFTDALGAMYVRRHFDNNARELTLSLVDDVQTEFLSMLSNVDWMDPITKGRTLIKAKAMEETIAYPLELLNDKILEDFYFNISIPKNKYFSSALQMRKIWTDYKYGKLRQFHNRQDWRSKSSVLEVNAFYNPSENSMMIPAGVLQGVFFGNDRPRYVNYGAIGSFIGHEITHGFDDQGRKFNEIGNLEPWGQAATDAQFVKKAKCIIDQYSRYNMTLINRTVDGVNTLGENIADNGGVKAAYRAYRKWESNNYEEKSLPGMIFTTRQLFWMSFANLWCMKTTPKNALSTILTDKHSPSIFRVNGVVSNSPEFSADFKCPTGSPMNPVKKCAVW